IRLTRIYRRRQRRPSAPILGKAKRRRQQTGMPSWHSAATSSARTFTCARSLKKGGAPSGKWFGSDAEAAADWAVRENAANRNVYWTVNRARSGQDKKPRKADIESARWCHVDIDPPFEPEAKRAELT